MKSSLRSRYHVFHIRDYTIWFFPFWWSNNYSHIVKGWRCFSWVRRPRNNQQSL